ncbi:hypothetical protein JCM11641_001005 [Rhodosporidiobolus odoratus]
MATFTQSTAQNAGAKAQLSVDSHTSRVDVIDAAGGRVLCVADVRGAISTLNTLAAEHSAVAIIHSGDFGFYEPSSLATVSDRTLKHLVQYSSLISPQFRSQLLSPNTTPPQIRELLAHPPKNAFPDPSEHAFGLSEFPKLLAGELKLNVPVYTVWGACEDVAILEKIRLAPPSAQSIPTDLSNVAPAPPSTATRPSSISPTPPSYSIPNLTVLDEATTRVLLIGGVRLRLFGLGGAVVPHKLFDNGSGTATIAGGQGTMWTTMLQIGELVDTAQKVYDPSETRVLISHASPGREGLLAQLALVLKADLTISAGLHFRYGVSYNEFSVQHDPEAFKGKLDAAKKSFNDVWDAVKVQVESVVDDNQRLLLQNAIAVANRIPASQGMGGGAAIEEAAWKNCWHWNLPDAAFGSLVLDVRDGRIGSELKSQGFNFAYRQNTPKPAPPPAASTSSASTGPIAPVPSAPSTNANANANANAAPAPASSSSTSGPTPSSYPNNLSGRPNAANHYGPGAGNPRASPGNQHPHHRAPSGPRGGGRGGFAGHGGWNMHQANVNANANSNASANAGTAASPQPPTSTSAQGQGQGKDESKPVAPAPASKTEGKPSSPAPAPTATPAPTADATSTPTPTPSTAKKLPSSTDDHLTAGELSSGAEASPLSGGSGGEGAGGRGGRGRGGRGRGARGRSNGEWRGRGGRGKSGTGSGSGAEGTPGGAVGESKPATPAPAAAE